MTNKTKRAVSEGLEEILFQEFPVLDKGFISPVDYQGNDQTIPNAARTSYQTGTTKVNNDRNLIRYLMKHEHASPFEFCQITFRIKAPLFVAGQTHRHRTQSINQQSARYSVMVDEFYIPERDVLQPQSKTNKQGRDGELTEEQKDRYLEVINNICQTTYSHYEEMINETNGEIIVDDVEGLSRELARMVLPQNLYTNWVFTMNLRNLFNFLRLRMDSHAQYEIRAYADAMYEITKAWCPDAVEAFDDYMRLSTTYSRMEQELLINEVLPTDIKDFWADMVFDSHNNDEKALAAKYGMSMRELNDLKTKLGV